MASWDCRAISVSRVWGGENGEGEGEGQGGVGGDKGERKGEGTRGGVERKEGIRGRRREEDVSATFALFTAPTIRTSTHAVW